MQLLTGRITRAAGLAVLFAITCSSQLFAKTYKCNDTWRDNVRGEYGVFRVDFNTCSRDKQTFKIYRNKDWEGKKNTFEKIEEFTLSPKSPKHSKKYPEFYKSAFGPIIVDYTINVDYKNGRVHSKGTIDYPKPPSGPASLINLLVREKKQWDQYFTEIPSNDDVIYLPEGTKDYVEVSEFWTGFCSDIACGPWVRFQGYSETHRYNANIPGVGPAIIQLWKGYCPRFNQIEEYTKKVGLKTIPLVNIGKNFPGGLGAEVGVYVPRSGKTMMDAALTGSAPLTGEWMPLVNKNIRISFQLVDKKTGQVVVDAPEKMTWWRTKWKNVGDPLKPYGGLKDPLEYELRYKINGVEQPAWGYSGKEGMVTGVGRYPEIGFNGIWKQDEKLAQLIGPVELGMLFDFKVLELYHNGSSITLNTRDLGWKGPMTVPLNGTPVRGEDKIRGPYTLAASQTGGAKGNLILEYKYEKAAALDRTYELIFKDNGDIHILNTPVIFYPL